MELFQALKKHRLVAQRFIVLVICAFVGGFFLYKHEAISCVFNLPQGRLRDSLILIIVSFPVLVALWYFRTIDVREKILQAELFDAQKMLMDGMVVSREIGTERLIKLSETTPQYNEEIKTAFLGVLKSFRANEDKKERRTYGEKILLWFYKNKKLVISEDFNGCVFDNQDFSSKNQEKVFHFFRKEIKLKLSFVSAKLTEMDLTGINLADANLIGADLSLSNLQDTILDRAKLIDSKLLGTNFKGASVVGVNWRGAVYSVNTQLPELNIQNLEEMKEGSSV